MAAGSTALAAPQSVARVAPRDKLTITVFDVPQFSGPFTVGVDGTIEYPILGMIKAAGLTPRELEAEIRRQLANGYVVNPQVSVDVEQAANKRFSVIGQVANPGTFAYGGQITLLEAILRAGSTREDAADEVTITHAPDPDAPAGAPDEVVRVDLYDLINNASNRNNVAIQDGDTIRVQKAEPVYVMGYVANQGPYVVHRNTTVEKAIALAGGISELGSTGRIKITRLVNGKKKEISVKDYKTEMVQPGDTITVGRRFA
jgi:polysaccharide export outer membrane protein